MPITKTAKRALRGSDRKYKVNASILTNLEIAVRNAKKSKKSEDVRKAIALADRAAKKHVFHKNKAARIKSSLSKFAKPEKTAKKAESKKPAKKTAPKKAAKKSSK